MSAGLAERARPVKQRVHDHRAFMDEIGELERHESFVVRRAARDRARRLAIAHSGGGGEERRLGRYTLRPSLDGNSPGRSVHQLDDKSCHPVSDANAAFGEWLETSEIRATSLQQMSPLRGKR